MADPKLKGPSARQPAVNHRPNVIACASLCSVAFTFYFRVQRGALHGKSRHGRITRFDRATDGRRPD